MYNNYKFKRSIVQERERELAQNYTLYRFLLLHGLLMSSEVANLFIFIFENYYDDLIFVLFC